MGAYQDPRLYNLERIETLRMKSRVASSNATLSIQRSRQEPETRHVHAIDPELAEGLLSATNIIMQSALSLEAFLVDSPTQHTIDKALGMIATSIDKEQPLDDFPDVQVALTTLEHVNASTSSTPIMLRFVQAEARGIVRGVNAMHELLITRAQDDK